MLTLTTSQQAALDAAVTDVRVVVEVDALTGTYRWAETPLRWSGRDYSGRLLNPAGLRSSIEGATQGIVTAPSITIEVADGDGLLTRKRPTIWRGVPCRVRTVLTEIDSDVLRSVDYTVTGFSAEGGVARLTAEHALQVGWRTLVPATLITKDRWVNIDDGSPVLGRPVPQVFGRCYAPLLLVDQRSSAGDRYVVCAGSASFPGAVVEWWQGAFSPVFAPPGIGWTETYTATCADRGGLQVSEVTLAAGIPAGNPPTPRYLDVEATFELGGGNYERPTHAFAVLLYEAGLSAHLDAAAWLAADSYYRVTSHTFDCALTVQRPFSDWLDDLAHDGLCQFRVTSAGIAIFPIASRAMVDSFHPGNILAGTLRVTDAPLGSEGSWRILTYRERTTDPFPEVSERPLASRAEWQAGSGTLVERVSPFIGKQSVAQRVVRAHAQIEAAGVRRYEFASTVRKAALEVGDAVSLTHSAVGADNLRCEIIAIAQDRDVYQFTLREAPLSMYDVGTLPADRTDFGFSFQRVGYNAGYYLVQSSTLLVQNSQTVIGSHQLAKTPVAIAPVLAMAGYTVQCSLIAGATTNASQFTVLNVSQVYGVSIDTLLLGWDVRA